MADGVRFISTEVAARILDTSDMPEVKKPVQTEGISGKVVESKVGNKWLNVVACRRPQCRGAPFDFVMSIVRPEQSVIKVLAHCPTCDVTYAQSYLSKVRVEMPGQ